MTNNERSGILGLLVIAAFLGVVAGSAFPLRVAGGITIPAPIVVAAVWCLAVSGIAVLAIAAVKLAFWAVDVVRPFSRFLQAVMEVAIRQIREKREREENDAA